MRERETWRFFHPVFYGMKMSSCHPSRTFSIPLLRSNPDTARNVVRGKIGLKNSHYKIIQWNTEKVHFFKLENERENPHTDKEK